MVLVLKRVKSYAVESISGMPCLARPLDSTDSRQHAADDRDGRWAKVDRGKASSLYYRGLSAPGIADRTVIG